MRIRRIDVTNFRSLRASSLNFTASTALIGENNSGKSAFLLALDLFFASSPRVKDRDFSDRNIDDPIDITVHFSDLTPYDRDEFGANMLDGALVITRRFVFNDAAENGKYFISARVNPVFTKCRNENGKTEKRALYAEVRERYGNPADLPKEKSADEIDKFLEQWEAAHPDALEVQKIGVFRGWTNVAAGKLKQKTSYILIRAVQDAAEDIQENKNSPVKSLIDTIARQTIENSSGFKVFLQEASQRISELTNPDRVPILGEMSSGLTAILTDYYKNSEIIATWDPVTELRPSFPSTNIQIKDNEFVTGLDGVGHGLQRAVILTVLRFMANHKAQQEASEQEFDEPQSDLIVAIEEPEIYQHPTKQRLFGRLLPKLAESFSKQTGIRVQTIFVTHSPLLISIGRCEGIRMIGAKSTDGKRNVNVNEISLDRCAKRSAEVFGRSANEAWSAAQFGAKLHTFGSEIGEGFFSKCVILVEGVGDKSVIEAWYEIGGRDPQAEGIVIVAVSGKNNLSKPIVIFQELKIPCYWIFDNDESNTKQKKEHSSGANRALQRLAGIVDEKCVDWPCGQYYHFTSLDNNLEKYVRGKVGAELFDSASAELSKQFDIDVDMCLKFPASASSMLRKFQSGGTSFEELDRIVVTVDKLIDAQA
jgi:putative ATP-dependent endonuclease of the OLD family